MFSPPFHSYIYRYSLTSWIFIIHSFNPLGFRRLTFCLDKIVHSFNVLLVITQFLGGREGQVSEGCAPLQDVFLYSKKITLLECPIFCFALRIFDLKDLSYSFQLHIFHKTCFLGRNKKYSLGPGKKKSFGGKITLQKSHFVLITSSPKTLSTVYASEVETLFFYTSNTSLLGGAEIILTLSTALSPL